MLSEAIAIGYHGHLISLFVMGIIIHTSLGAATSVTYHYSDLPYYQLESL